MMRFPQACSCYGLPPPASSFKELLFSLSNGIELRGDNNNIIDSLPGFTRQPKHRRIVK